MLRTRVIPCLSLIGDSLVKTVRFSRDTYIGDPLNTARIFNELEVDELMLLDIRAAVQNRAPNFDLLARLADECFMPLAYGGGIRDFATAKRIFTIGVEKVVVNTAAHHRPELITEIAGHFGSQAVIASIDIKKNLFGKLHHWVGDGKMSTSRNAVEWAKELERLGAGELLLTSMDKDGTWTGYDVETVKKFSDALSIPIIANGGAGTVEHLGAVIKKGGASAAAVGSMVVYQKQGMGVLINFPDRQRLEQALS